MEPRAGDRVPVAMPLPHPILRRLLVRRGLVLWVLARLMLLVALVLLPILAGGRVVPPPAWRDLLAAPQLLPFLAFLVWVDLHRRREVLLIANLGQSRAAAVLLACAPGIALELAALAAFTSLPV